MLKTLVILTLISTSAFATSLEYCPDSVVATEAQMFLNYKIKTGNVAIGNCLEQKIRQAYVQESVTTGVKVTRNLLNDEFVVMKIKADIENKSSSPVTAAEMKAEIFENGLDADGKAQ